MPSTSERKIREEGLDHAELAVFELISHNVHGRSPGAPRVSSPISAVMRSYSAMSGVSVSSSVSTASISRAKALGAATTNPRAGLSLSTATT